MYSYENTNTPDSTRVIKSLPVNERYDDGFASNISGLYTAQMKSTGGNLDELHDRLAQRINSRKNNTGLPDNLKNGIENISGFSMDNVNVHYNSEKPAQLQALAYAEGEDIYVAPGQEKHIPHEAWHVVQQKQGRVAATEQINGININNNTALEHEADVMGARAAQFAADRGGILQMKKNQNAVVQMEDKLILERELFDSEQIELYVKTANKIISFIDSRNFSDDNKALGINHRYDVSDLAVTWKNIKKAFINEQNINVIIDKLFGSGIIDKNIDFEFAVKRIYELYKSNHDIYDSVLNDITITVGETLNDILYWDIIKSSENNLPLCKPTEIELTSNDLHTRGIGVCFVQFEGLKKYVIKPETMEFEKIVLGKNGNDKGESLASDFNTLKIEKPEISETEKENITELKIGDISGSKIGSISGSEIGSIRIGSISGSKIGSISGSEIVNISESEIVNISGSEIGSISGSKIWNISKSEIGNINESEIGSISGSKIVNISESKIGNIRETIIENMRELKTGNIREMEIETSEKHGGLFEYIEHKGRSYDPELNTALDPLIDQDSLTDTIAFASMLGLADLHRENLGYVENGNGGYEAQLIDIEVGGKYPLSYSDSLATSMHKGEISGGGSVPKGFSPVFEGYYSEEKINQLIEFLDIAKTKLQKQKCRVVIFGTDTLYFWRTSIYENEDIITEEDYINGVKDFAAKQNLEVTENNLPNAYTNMIADFKKGRIPFYVRDLSSGKIYQKFSDGSEIEILQGDSLEIKIAESKFILKKHLKDLKKYFQLYLAAVRNKQNNPQAPNN